MKTKYYAVINTKWKEDGWDSPFYSVGIRGEQVLGLSIFNSRKEAQKFRNSAEYEQSKVVEVVIKIKE